MSFDNAIKVALAMGGSTNAVIHLVALAVRAGLTTRKISGMTLGENIAPNGAVIKRSAAKSRLLNHHGPAIVFKDYNGMKARIDVPNLVVGENSVLVLQNGWPNGGP